MPQALYGNPDAAAAAVANPPVVAPGVMGMLKGLPPPPDPGRLRQQINPAGIDMTPTNSIVAARPDLATVATAPAAVLQAGGQALGTVVNAPSGMPMSPVASGGFGGPTMTPQDLLAAKQASQTNVADTLTGALGATAAAQHMQAHVAAGQYAAALGDEANIAGRTVAGVAAAPFVGAAKLGAATYDNVVAPAAQGLVGFGRAALGLPDTPAMAATPAQVASAPASAPPAPSPIASLPAFAAGPAPLAVGTTRTAAMVAADAPAVAAGKALPVPEGAVLTDTGWARPGMASNTFAAAPGRSTTTVAAPAAPVAPTWNGLPVNKDGTVQTAWGAMSQGEATQLANSPRGKLGDAAAQIIAGRTAGQAFDQKAAVPAMIEQNYQASIASAKGKSLAEQQNIQAQAWAQKLHDTLLSQNPAASLAGLSTGAIGGMPVR